MDANITWSYSEPPREKGIITGGDQNVECLLPWWLDCLRKKSQLPVLFFDFGLSPKGKAFAEKHLEVIPLNIAPELLQKRFAIQEAYEGEIAKYRKEQRTAWFTKPFALLKTPFKHSLWLDLDCEVVHDISPLFDYAEKGCALAPSASHILEAKKRTGLIKESGQDYNAGVIPYLHGSPLIEAFAKATIELEGYFPGDQEILAHVINEGGLCEPLPRIYNWQIPDWGTNRAAVIQHWKGHKAKNFLIEKVIRKRPDLCALL